MSSPRRDPTHGRERRATGRARLRRFAAIGLFGLSLVALVLAIAGVLYLVSR
jgi:hypothetical protein